MVGVNEGGWVEEGLENDLGGVGVDVGVGVEGRGEVVGMVGEGVVELEEVVDGLGEGEGVFGLGGVEVV